MKKILFFAIITLLFVTKSVTAQEYLDEESISFEKRYNTFEDLPYGENFESAIGLYKNSLSVDPKNSDLNFKLGICYLYTNLEKEKSIECFQKAVYYMPKSGVDFDVISNTSYFLGVSYRLNYKFDKAIKVFEDLKIDASEDKDLVNKLNREIAMCENAKELLKHPVNLTVTNMGNSLNSSSNDHSPLISQDETTMIFTSTRDGSTGGNEISYGENFEDIYISHLKNGHWSTPESVGKKVNTIGHEAACCLSAQGNELYIYKGNNIYVSKLRGRKWSEPKKLDYPICSENMETHASISVDGQHLYFTSNRPGGYGGLDIYVSKKEGDNWGKPENMGPNVNTAYNEETPYIHPDGVSLYFSSQGHKTMGGYDIFLSNKKTDGSWSEPENIGYPVNTANNDVFYVPSLDGKRAYYSSHKAVGLGGLDIYQILFNDENKQELTMLQGVLNSSNGSIPVGSLITIRDMSTKNIINKYIPSTDNGKYFFVLDLNKSYNFLYEADDHLFQMFNLSVLEIHQKNQITKDITLQPIRIGNTRQMYCTTLPPGTTMFNSETAFLLESISKYLIDNERISLDISASQEDSIKDLTDRRFNIIANYLIESGVEQGRIYRNLEQDTIYGDTLKLSILDDYTKEVALYEKEEGSADDFEEFEMFSSSRKKNNFLTKLKNNSDKLASNVHNTGKDEIINETSDPKSEILDNIEIVETKDTIENKIIKDVKTDVILPKREIVIVRNILFNVNSYDLSKHKDNLEKLIAYLKNNSGSVIEIGGFSDTQGNASYNSKLAKKRADNIKNHLLKNGISSHQLVAVNYGTNKQISVNKTPNGSWNWESLKYNRRVEFKVMMQGKAKLEVKQIEVPEQLRVTTYEDEEDYEEGVMIYSILVITSKTKVDIESFGEFKSKMIEHKTQDGSFRYYYGRYKDDYKARTELEKIREKYPTALIFIN